MDVMVQYELLLDELYRKCAGAWPQDADFWLGIARQEVHHAENIKAMQEIIKRKPSYFEVGKPLNPIGVNTAISGLKNNIKRLEAGEYSYEQMLITARDIEQSVLEAHYAEIVKTTDVEYQSLMQSIITETHEHRGLIQKKLNDVKLKR
jgi:hypothetical protein